MSRGGRAEASGNKRDHARRRSSGRGRAGKPTRPAPATPTGARPSTGQWLFAVAQDVHDGDAGDEDAGAWRAPPGGAPGGVVVDGVAPWWSVCRGGGFLADGGAGGGFIDDALAGCVGGQERGDGEPVDGPGQAAGLAVDDADGAVGEQGVGPADQRQVRPQVPAGFAGAEGGGGDVVAQGDALVEGYLEPPETAAL